MPRECPFCRGRADSREHVYPQWISRRFLEGASERAFFTMRMGTGIPERRTRTLNQTVKVCSTCNNGWMSRLESTASPLLAKLAIAELPEITPDDQGVIAHWLVKNAVIHEIFSAPEHRVSTATQRSMLAQGEVPDGWTVYLAAAELGDEQFVHHMGPLLTWRWEDGGFRGSARLHTTRFGLFASQVVLYNLDEEPTFESLLGGPEWAAQIWPVGRSITWPPGRILTALRT